MGTFAQWALPHLIANRLRRRTGPHHSRRGPLTTSFYIGAHTRVLALRFSQEPFIARLVTCMPLCNSMLSATPGGRSALVFSAPPAWPAPGLKGSAHTQNLSFSELWFRFRAYTLHLAALVYLPFRLLPSGHYASERLTRPYSGELTALAALSQLTNIARLPKPPKIFSTL